MGIGACEVCGSGHHYGHGQLNMECLTCVTEELYRARNLLQRLKAHLERLECSLSCEVAAVLKEARGN